MVSSGVNIKVGIDVSQAKTGLEQLRKEFEALGSTRPKSNLTFLDTIKTSLNSIKNTMDQLKSAFTQGFSVIEKSADGTNTVLRTISVNLDKTAKSAEKATKSAESLGSALSSAGMKSDEAFLTADQKAAKFNAKIDKMIGTIDRLNQDELRFAKTPFDINDKFFAINSELMKTIGYLKEGEHGADLLRKAFTTLGDGEDINKIAGSLIQLEGRVNDVNNVMRILKASTVSLNQVGLAPKSLGEWGKVNNEMLQSDKTAQQLKNKLLSLDNVQFSNVYNSVQLLKYTMQEGLIPQLINANNKLKEYQANAKRLSDNMIIRSGNIQKMSLLGGSGDLQTLERVPKAIQEISKAYNEGTLSTERYIARMKEAVAGLSNQQYDKLSAEITRYESKLKMLGSTMEQLQTIAKSNVSLTPFNAKSDVTVQYLVRQYEQGVITIRELSSRLSSLNAVQVNPKIQPFIKDLQEGKISTEQLKIAVESLQNVNLGANVQVTRLVEQLRTGKITAEELRVELMKLNETSMQRVASNVTNVTKNLERAVNTLSEAQARMLSNQYKANAGAGGISAYAQSNLNYKPTPVTPKVDYGEITRYNQAMTKQAIVSSNVTGIMSRYSKEIESATRKNDLIASASNKASNSVNRVGRAAGSAKKQVNALDKVSGMLRRTISGLVVIFGWDLATDLIEIGKNSMDAATQIRLMGQSMGWTNSQVSSFTGRMRELQGIYPKIDMSQTAKSVMEMAKTYRLTNSEANRLIKTSAVFTSAMAKEGRSTEDANLALKDYLDGGSGWTRRMSEIGATREKLKATGKWSGNENDINGKIEALDVLMAQKGYDELAKNIYTLDDAFNAFKYTLGSVIGELGEGLTPTIVAFTKIALSTIQSIRSGISWIKGNGWANEIGQLLAVAGAVSLISIGVLKLVGAIKGILMAKTLITTMASPLGIILITVSAITVAIYGIGRALGWWHDFNSMVEAISNNLMTMQGQLELIVGVVGTLGSLFLAKKYLDESNIIVRCIDKVIGAIKSYIGALAAKKAAEEASAATTAGTKGGEAVATAGAAGVEAAAAGKVAKDGKNVSKFSKILGTLGVEYSADAGFVTMFSAGATALSSMLGAAIPIIAGLTAIVGLVMLAVAVLAAEAILLVKGLQMLIASMNFDGIDLSSAVKGIKQIGTAMSELSKAVYGMLSISAMMTLIGFLDVITLGFGSVAAACNKLKSSVSQINSFANTPPINKEAITRLTQIAGAMNSLAKATESMGSMNSTIHWAIFWQWINGGILENLQKAHNKLASAVPIINSFNDLDDINPATSKKIKAVCDSLADVSKGTESLGKTGGDVHWAIFWQWINGGILENLSKARSKLEDASRILNQFQLAEIPKGTGEKLKRVSYALLDVNEALNNLDKLPNVTNDAKTIAKVGTYATTMANIRGVLESVSKELRILSFTYAIPDGTGGKIQRISWTLRDVETAFKTLQSVLANLNFDGDHSSVISSIQNVGRVLRGVSLELNALSTVAVMPTDVGVKLQRITWVLNDVRTAGVTLNNVLMTLNNLTLDVNSTTTSLQNIGRVIRSVSIELNALSTIAVMPEGLGEKLQRMTWTLNSLKATVTALNSAYYGNLVNIPPAEGFHGKLIALRQILYQISGFANAVSTYGTANANGNGIAEMVKNVTTQVNACVTAVNNAVSRLKNAGKNLGSALKTGVASGVSNTAHSVWVQINSINSALSSVQGKVKQTTSVFSTFQSRVYTLTQGINNLKNAINNIPSSKTVTITINASTNTKGAGFGGLFAGWSVSSALGSDWDTISNYHGGTASTNSLFGGLKSRVHGRVHGLFAGIKTGGLVDNPKTLNPLQAFSVVASDVMNGSSYDHYYNSKNNGDVNDTLASGRFNCYDGSLLLMSLASLFGLKSEMKGTMVGGEGHAYTRVGGKVFDATAMQLYHKRTSPKVNYAGIGGSKAKGDGKDSSKPISVTVNVNGDVYGERDFKDKIRSGAEEVLIELFNNSRGTGI